MKIDLAVGLIILFFGVMGLFSGAIRQLGHMGGIVAGYLFARPVGQVVGPVVAQKFGYPPLFTSIGCSFLAFFAIYLVVTIVTRAVLGRIFPDGERGALNRMGGLAIGSLKSGLILFMLLSGLVFLEKPIGNHLKEFRAEAKASIGMALARRYNVFSSLPQLNGLAKLFESIGNPEAQAQLASNPEFKGLTRDPRMQSLVKDESVRKAFENGDYGSLFGSIRVLDALNDPRLSEQLSKLSATEMPEKAAAAGSR